MFQSFRVGDKRVMVFMIWAASCENVISGICGQRRPRLVCISEQSDQGYYCPLHTQWILYNVRMESKSSDVFFAGWSNSVHFAHARRHCFAWRGLHDPSQVVQSFLWVNVYLDLRIEIMTYEMRYSWLAVSNSLILNNCLSRSENLVPA